MAGTTGAPRRGGASRRHFLTGAGATIGFATASYGVRAGDQRLPRHGIGGTGPNRQALVYPINQPTSGPYPEQAIARYSAAAGQWGVAFSGGGPRAFSAALGQMRGLQAAGVVGDVGAISCVSGGTWFGTTYTFAPTSFSDATLLGPLVPPANLTVAGLNQLGTNSLGSLMTGLSDDAIVAFVGIEYAKAYFGYIPYDKVYARALNDTLLMPLGLANTSTLFTLNATTLKAIRARNPGLTASFQLPRPGRPFFIAGGTQIYQQNQLQQAPVRQVGLPGQVYRSIEYTPLYVGAPQLVQQNGAKPLPYGGGYLESFAFDSPAPAPQSQVSAPPGGSDTPLPESAPGNVVSVPPGQYPFLLSDVMGSSSAAIAAFVKDILPAKYNSFDPFPEFDYWPVTKIGRVPATTYSFGDGGILENTGVVALLRRGYRTIFAFVNSPFPIGSSSDECVSGIDGQISRLFGLVPKGNLGTTQSTQVFATAQYASVVQGLKAARSGGGAPVYASSFPVIAGNKFGLAPYTPKIFWIYNDLNEAWYGQLQQPVKALLNDPNNKYGLKNFPNYNTVFQNEDELLRLTATQVNLLSQMWAYTVDVGFKTPGQAFGVPIS